MRNLPRWLVIVLGPFPITSRLLGMWAVTFATPSPPTAFTTTTAEKELATIRRILGLATAEKEWATIRRIMGPTTEMKVLLRGPTGTLYHAQLEQKAVVLAETNVSLIDAQAGIV